MADVISTAISIYLDANAIIYFIERDDALQGKVATVIETAVSNNIPIYVSEIGIAECLYGTYRQGRESLTAKYQELFYEIGLLSIIPINGEIVIAAAKTGAEKGLKLVDAIHFQSAINANCTVFVTNDDRFQTSHAVEAIQLKNL